MLVHDLIYFVLTSPSLLVVTSMPTSILEAFELQVLIYILKLPGIIICYRYFMLPYILAENPGVTADRVFEICMKTMDCEIPDTALLMFTLLGWVMLGNSF